MKAHLNTIVLPCGCQSLSEDRKHGSHRRMHRPLSGGWFRCMVCGNRKTNTTVRRPHK